jgi:glycosyltransferase involved in cell wall biosynthesis
VRIAGSIAHSALLRRYDAASIFALPSTREGYPIVLAEALAYGLPVVGSDIAGIRAVTARAAVLVAPGRVRPLAAALAELHGDERTYRDRVRRSLDRARELPTWAESEARFVRVVRSS